MPKQISIEDRLAGVEHRVRSARVVAAGIALVVAAVVFSAATKAPPGTITASKLRVVDKAGKLAILVQELSGQPAIVLYDRARHRQVAVTGDSLMMSDRGGKGEDSEPRILLGILPDNRAGLLLTDSDGQVTFMATSVDEKDDEQEFGHITFMAADGAKVDLTGTPGKREPSLHIGGSVFAPAFMDMSEVRNQLDKK